MGVDFVIFIENKNSKTQKQVNKKLGINKIKSPNNKTLKSPNWKCFYYKGKKYCSWYSSPRYFNIDAEKEKWKPIRAQILKAKRFLGDGKVFLGNDVAFSHNPEEEKESLGLPPELDLKYLIERS